MDKKFIYIIVAVIVVIAAVGAILVINGGNNQPDPEGSLPAVKTLPTDMPRLNVLGNANMDDEIDNNDVEFVKKVITSKTNNNFYCDANHDGNVDKKDLDFIRTMIDGTTEEVYYVNVADEVKSVQVPIENLMTGFRRINEMVAVLGCTDMIVATTNGGLQQYEYIGFTDTAKKNIINPGQGNDSNPSSETILAIYKEYANKGGITILGDNNGMSKDMESIAEGLMDVVRLGCTESNRYDDGMVTLAYLLHFNKSHAKAVSSGIEWWVNWNDDIVDQIEKAAAKMTSKEKSIVALVVLGGTNINLRGESTAEQVLASAAGVDYLYKYAEKYGTLSNEAILAMQKEGMKKVVLESNNFLKSITTKYNAAKTEAEKKAALNYIEDAMYDAITRDTMTGYNGDYYMLPQEMCCGAEIPMYRMYIASIFIPSLANVFTKEYISQQAHDFIERINPNSPLKDAVWFYEYDQ